VLRKIFGLKIDEVTGDLRKLHNEELRNLHSSPGHVTRMGESRNAYRTSVGKPEGKRTLGRPRRKWVGNIKMDFMKIGWGGMDWIWFRIGTSGGLLRTR
jgi:hypothetical protein